jgi:hypothetical protein
MKRILCISLVLGGFFGAKAAFGLTAWSDWVTAQPYVSKQIPPYALIVRGAGTNAYYVMEADPTTGAIPVTATVTNNAEGTPGSAVPSKALYTAGTDGTNLRGLKTDTSGELQIDVLTLPVAFNAGAASSTTVRVVPTTDAPSPLGRSYADSVRKDYTGGSVTTGAWVQLIASTASAINCVTVFDSSGQTLELGTGAAASETRVLIIPPGGLGGCIPLKIAASTRVAIRAISATASVGELDLSGLN